ncbi:hypothetical protein BN2537_7443 [Streptomyces venezuelae]|nr:hypothetical protein BN2537_7443 [Streptomyces venezuelae]
MGHGLIVRHPLRAATSGTDVTSGDHLGASRNKITAHPAS